MRIDQLVLLFALVLAANLVLLVALQLPRLGRRLNRQAGSAENYPSATRGTSATGGPGGGDGVASPLISGSSGLPPGLYQRMTRVVSFIFIAAAMATVVLTGAQNATAIIVLLIFALILIELFQDVLPATALGRWRLPLEATVVLVFLTVLIALTGGQNSPYFFGYILLVGGAALSTSDVGGAVLAMISSVAYLAAVLVASNAAPLASADFGVVAFNLVSIALVMYVASVIGREQHRAREEALRLSRFDSLTTLHSRDYFTSELEQEILRATRTGRPFAVAMLDLDGLKAANDRFGHDWGDNLLKAVADVLKGDVRVTDVAARYGGDEFALMLPETDLSGAILVAEKVRVDISRIALPHNGAVVRTSASIGIVTFPEDGRSSAELMRRADLAMYEAKRRGRDQIVRFARDPSQPIAQPSGPRAHATASAPLSNATQPATTMQLPPSTSPVTVPTPAAIASLPPFAQPPPIGAPAAVAESPPALEAAPTAEPPPAIVPVMSVITNPNIPAQPAPDVPLEAPTERAPAYSAASPAVPPASPGPAPWEVG